MKYIILLVAVSLLVFISCKGTKTSTAPKTVAAAVTVNPAQLGLAQKRWPATAPDELREGETIFNTKCTRCHTAYVISGFSEKK